MRRRVHNNDDGTSLLIVLILITVVSLVMTVVLSQVDTSVKATVVLRDQSATNYGADAAAQAIVTQLQNGTLSCSTPTGTTTNLGTGTATPFYSAVSTTTGPLNATATCAPDTAVGTGQSGQGPAIGATNTPPFALTTVGKNSAAGEDGVAESGNWSMCVQGGGVQSYSTITGKVSAGVNTTDNTACPTAANTQIKVQAYGDPTPATSGCQGTFTPTACTALGATTPAIPTVPDPGLAITAANTNQAAVCQTVGSTVYAAFLPGKYTLLTSNSVSSLSTPCLSKGKWVAPDVAWFTPGVFYFDFGSTTWSIPDTVIGGTPTKPGQVAITGLNGTSAATLATSTLGNLSQATTFPGACLSPTTQTNNGGSEFVFGGASTMTINGGNLDLCANYTANTVPVALYGVYQNALVEGSGSVAPQSGCVATVGCNGASSLLNAGSPNGHESFHFEGYVWAPASAIAMTYKNSAGQEFTWGVLVRTFQITGNGSSPSSAFISLPSATFGAVTTYSYRYISVWVCPAAATACAQTGTPAVRVKVQTTGSTWKVLSWSHQR